MSGFTTQTTDHLIRSNLWRAQLKEDFREDLMATKYVNWLTDFPDGDTFNIPSIGQAEVLDYEEGQAIRYTSMPTGNFTFSITEYKSSATYITDKMKQDSMWSAALEARFVPEMRRALAVTMETDVLAIGNSGQTASSLNTINGGDHRIVASGTGETMSPVDFAKAKYALQMANVPMTNLVAIVDPTVEYTLSTQTNLVNLINNPMWEGIVRTGASSGMRFLFNIYGFDVYTSHFLPSSISETISGTNGGTVTAGVANYFFSAAGGETSPFIGAVRQEPNVESERNKDLQRDEYVVTTRYGFGFYRPENLVTVLTDTDAVFS